MRFINIDDPTSVPARHGQEALHRPQLPRPLCLIDDRRLLEPGVLFLFDAGLPIYFSKQSRIHVNGREISPCIDDPVGQGHADLPVERLLLGQPLHLMGLEEAEAIFFSLVDDPILFHLLDQRQLLSFGRGESGLDEPADLLPGAAENLF